MEYLGGGIIPKLGGLLGDHPQIALCNGNIEEYGRTFSPFLDGEIKIKDLTLFKAFTLYNSENG